MSPLTFKPAKRENVPLLLGLAGGTGSGKTMSAMRLAKGMAGSKPFAVIDTEAGRALHYADMFAFDHAELGAPFRPGKYLEAIKAAEAAGYPVILVDSISHEWDGPGGMLEWHDELMGGKEAKKLSSWILPKTEHRKFVNELTQLHAHLILCFRAAKKVEMVKVDGKWEIVEKQSLTGLNGWIPITEKSLPFELTLSVLLTADEPGIPHPIKLQDQHRPYLPLHQPIGEHTGEGLAQWASGVNADTTEQDDVIKMLIGRLLAVPGVDAKRQAVLAKVAENRELHAADLGAHVDWLAAQVELAQSKSADRQDEDLDL